MFGIKTKIVKKASGTLTKLFKGKIVNDIAIREIMVYFMADTSGHRANVKKADLGYGFLHYGFIRTVKPIRILCIGSRHGYIPAILAQACKDNGLGHVDFVDPGYGRGDKNHWTGAGYWKTPKGKDSFRSYGLGRWITLYPLESKDFVKVSNKVYQYIYIDGDHSYQGVLLDYKLFLPRLAKFGFMSFHDVGVKGRMPEGEYGVHKLWGKLEKDNSIVFPFSKSGLGIIQKVTNEDRHKNIL